MDDERHAARPGACPEAHLGAYSGVYPGVRLCSTAEMQAMDAYAIEALGLPPRLLMENAASQVTNYLVQRVIQDTPRGKTLRRKASRSGTPPILCCCGPGNNGGDGYAVARQLRIAGLPSEVIALGNPRSAEAQANARVWERCGGTTHHWPQDAETIRQKLASATVLVDALFGIGLTRPLEGPAIALIEAIEAAIEAGAIPRRVAIDVPSGVDGDRGSLWGRALPCTETLCLQVLKQGLFQHPAREAAGQIHTVSIAIPRRWPPDAAPCYLLDRAAAAARLPRRPAAGHKGTFGHLLCVAGAKGMWGAAKLTALGALNAGTGLVTLALPRGASDSLAAALLSLPSLMTFSSQEDAPRDGAFPDEAHPWFTEADAEALLVRARESASAVVLGPGLGRRPTTASCVRKFIGSLDAVPLLLDADALHHLDRKTLQARRHPTLITPHPGELARLLDVDIAHVQADRLAVARRVAQTWRVIVILKGAGTVLAAPDGTLAIHSGGDQGLARGGSGDVLAGLIGGLLAQKIPRRSCIRDSTPDSAWKAAWNAACLGVYLHGLSRDLSREPSGASSSASSDEAVADSGIDPRADDQRRELRSAAPGGRTQRRLAAPRANPRLSEAKTSK